MGAPRSWAKIEFPVSLIDGEIRNYLIGAGVRFEGNGLEVETAFYGLEIEVENGIFAMSDGEARDGEFAELERLLVQRGIPFDRTSAMDFNCPPMLRVFRPGEPDFDLYYPLDSDAYEPVVSVAKIRELLERTDAEEEPAERIRDYLNFNFPGYPPLTDWVEKEAPL
jgi:hypothetical protein